MLCPDVIEGCKLNCSCTNEDQLHWAGNSKINEWYKYGSDSMRFLKQYEN